MAQNWWEDDPVAEGNNSNWWSSDPLADAPAADPARQELPAGVVPSAAGGGRGIVNPPVVQPDNSRTIGQIAGDTLLAGAQGAMEFAQLPGTVGGLITGNMDNAYSQFFQRGIDAAQSLKSEQLQAESQKLQAAMDAEPTLLGKFKEGFVGSVTNPALFADQVARMAPGIVGGGGVGRLVEGGAKTAAGALAVNALSRNSAPLANAAVAASRVAGAAPTAGAVGVTALVQGQGVGAEALQQAKQIPLEMWQANDAGFRELVGGGMDPEAARVQRANEMARTATGQAALISLVTQALPGGRSIETALVRSRVGGRLSGAASAGAKETVAEAIEEGAGSAVKDLQLSQANPDIDVLGNAAGAAGMGAGIGGPMGAAAGAISTRPGPVVNFTPADSPTAQAGLTPVVVPVPTQGATDAGATGPVQRATADGPGQRGDLGAPGVEPAGVGGVDPIGDVRPGAERVDAVDGAAGAVGDARVQPASPVAGDPLRRAADTNLLARAEAAQPTPAEQPVTIWTGRKGDGYDTRGDAEIALPTRVKREPELRWEIEQMPSGKFRLAGYDQQPAAQTRPEAQQQPQALTAQQFMQNPAQAIQTAQQITFAPGQLGAVKIADRKVLNGTFNVQEMDDGTTVFTRAAAPAGSPAVAGGLGQRAAQPSAEQQSAVLADLNKASAGRFAAVAANTSFAGVAQRIAAAFGRPVMLVRDRNGNAGFNALFYPRQGVIAANVDSDRPMYAVVTHEVYHGLPEDLRQRTTEAVMATVTPEQRARFLSEFAAYQKADAKVQDEELVARIIEQDAENPQFWQKLADRMGDGEFAKLAREILGMLDRLLAGFTREDSSEFTSDIKRVREVVADAYAEAQERLGEDTTVPGDAMASANRRRETVGDFQVVPAKDGSMTVLGEADAIRAAIPGDVQGRVVEGGIRFTTSDSQRVRAALEGRQVAYSRAGAVLDKLPMKDGKYLGAPPDYDTPGKIPTLRKILRNLTKEGEAGRFWYENSSKAVLRMTGGNVQEARKFVALLAIYSPQAKVDTNTTFAIRAWNQYKAGQPINVKTKVMDQKAAKAMQDIDAFWSGEKTGNFFFNLLREIDPTTEGKQGATIDMWMMRAGMYPTDAPTKTQYAFMENETNRIAAEMGWEPQQVQAAIWVAMKARMENSGVKKRTEASSEKKGWIRFDRDAKGKKVRVILDAQKHRDNWLAHAMRHVPSTTDTKTAKFDFEDGLFRHIGQISFEARPGRTSGSLPGIHSAPYAQQVEFQQAVQKTFYDERGTDMLASYLGLMIDNDILAPGVWQGEVSPSTQMSTVMAPAGGKAGKTNVDPAQKKLLNVYASVLGLLTRQEGVGWHRPFYATTKRDANGLDIDIGRPINPQEAADLERAVGAWMDRNGKPEWQNSFAFISSPKGIRLVNFGIITNEILQTEIVKTAESVLPDGSVRVFASDGDMPTNNWKENPNGETYVQGIRAEGRSDVLDWARGVLAPRIDAVFRDFAERYNWGDPGDVRFSAQRDGAGRQGAGRAAPGPLEAPERATQEAALTPLPGAPKVLGFHGPDPRLVAVAEKYAADNGIELRRQAEYVQVDPERAARIAEAYEAMPHAPQDPQVREAYENLIRQTRAQYDALVDAGYRFWFMDMSQPTSQEYASTPWNAMRDIRANQQMGVFPTEDGFGTNEDFTPESNPLLADTGLEWPSGSLTGPRKRVLANDLFRAVHDAFGHGLEGSGFRAQGEENAWQAHVRLFTGSAVGAITSETRGQNSWLNYGPYGAANRTAKVEDTVFADQKTGLMPEWTWTEGRAGDMPLASANRTAGRLDGIEAYHYSKASRQSLSSSSFGTGLQGSARDEYLNATDQRRRQRISFYVDKGTGIRPEAGVGGFAHRVTLNNIYDANSDPQNLRKGGQAAFETAVLDAGFDGYLDRLEGTQPGQVILLGRRTVNVTPVGPRTRIDDAKPVPAAAARKATREERGELVRRPDGQQMMGVINATKALRDAAPSFKLQYGEARVKVDEAAAANEALRQAGASFQFEIGDTPLASANRTVTETPEFKRWFGESKVVDERGAPLEVYHATGAKFNAFDPGKTGSNYPSYAKRGFFFYRSQQSATERAYEFGSNARLKRVYLSLQNPLVVTARSKGSAEEWFDRNNQALYSRAEKAGSDGIIVKVNPDSNDYTAQEIFIAFEPTQIKSSRGNSGQFDPENPDIRMSANRSVTETPEFKRWSNNAPLVMLGQRHEYRSGQPIVAEALHGTTNANLTEFRRDRASIESDFGAGFYSSNTPEDVAANYANNEGPDLTRRVERLAEQIAQDDEFEGDMNDAMAIARQRISEDSPNTLKLYVSFKNPAVLGGKGETFFDYEESYNEETDEYGEPTGLLVDFVNALDEAGADLDVSMSDLESTKAKLFEEAAGDGLKFGDLARIVKDGMADTYSEDGTSSGSSEMLRQALEGMGFDGVIDTTVVEKFGPRVIRGAYSMVKAEGMPGMTKDTVHFIAFKPTQMKSATGNTGAFDPNNPDIRMSANRAPIKGSRFTLPGMDGNRLRWDKIRRALQDDALRMKRVQDAVRDAGGVVNEEQNFYDANTLMPGRVQTMMDDFRKDVILPMIEKAAKAKIDLEELALYAYAKHAEERNDYIASINPRMPDGGSGMTTADANKILADIAASGKQADYDSLHQDLMSITETTRRVLLDEGLIDQDQFDAMEQQYGNYIPLRGFENVDEETGAIRPGIGRGINVRGQETIKALGRKSRAGDLIENVIRDYQRAVVRSEKNNVGKVLLDFVLSNPDPDLWGVDVDKTSASFDKKRGIVQYTKTIDKGEDTIGVKVAGKQVYIKLADKDLTRAIKQSFKDEVSGLERATVAVSGWYNNLLRNVLTRYNPPFAVVNAIRDTQSGLIAALDELGAKGAASFSAHLPKAIAATTADESGWKFLSNPLSQQYLREFKAAGAVTGGFFMRNLEDIAQDLRDDLLMAGATPRTIAEKAKFNPATKLAYKGARKFLRGLELAGAASENATRFALYMAARDMGKTPAQAALLAKNGTTNFNRKGEWGGALNNMYLFFNAAVQGNAQLFKTLKNPKVVAALTGVAGLAVTLGFLNAGMGGEDDDGEKYWDKVPNYEKERNLIIMLKPGDTLGEGISRVGKRGRYIKIPVQYGLNFFPNLGYSISDVIRNQQDPRQGKTVAKAGMHMASTFFGSLNPFGGSLDLTDATSVAMAVAPTIVDLPIQIGTERNSFGTPTAPTPFPGDNRPDSERMFISQMDGFAAGLAKVLNDLGGGNEAKAGKVLGVETAVTPGTIKTIIAGTTGGLGMFFEQIYDTTSGYLGDDKNVRPNRIPFLNKVYGEAGEDVNIRQAGERMREVRDAVDVIEKQVKAGIRPDMTPEDRRLVSIASAQETYNKESTKLRKDEIAVIRSTTMTPEQKRIARDNIMAARDKMATAVNRAYLNSFGINEKAAEK